MSTFNYQKAWQEVTDFENKGLPQSAMKVVNGIYEQAQKDNLPGQLVKAVIHQLKFVADQEDNSFIQNIQRLKKETAKATFPVKPLLHSMLAEMYSQYYRNNRYRFQQRSKIANTTSDNAEDDIETWSLDKIVTETAYHYTASLEDVKKSQATDLSIYPEVIYDGNELGRKYRPTLYDFVAHRALQYFMSEEPSVTQPVYAFALDQESYLSDASTFASLTLSSQDTLSLKFKALSLLQDLIRFHSNDQDPSALIDVDLLRLQFVRNNFTSATKNDLYLAALQSLEKNHLGNPTSTRVTFAIAQWYVEAARLYKPLQSTDHQMDLKKAYELCEEAKKRFNDSDGAIQCEQLQYTIRAKSLSAEVEENNLPAQPFRALVNYKNFTELHYRIIKTSRAEVHAQRKRIEKEGYDTRERKFLEFFIGKTAVKQGAFTLPETGDYQQHSLEVKIEGVPVGEYMILFSNRANFAAQDNGMAYAFTSVSNISYIHRSAADGSTEFFLLDRETGEPLNRVKAEIFTYVYNSKTYNYQPVSNGTFTSGVDGYIKVPFIKNENRRSFFAIFSMGEDVTSNQGIDEDYSYGSTLSQSKSYQPSLTGKTFFFLDRAIYRPGQTIYFKGLVVDTDGKKSTIRKGYRTIVTLYDVNDQPRGEVNVTTNEFGTFNGTLMAPASGLTGEMRLSSPNGDVSFSVEEYKRPKFEVDFSPVKGTFKLDDKITAEGFARAYSGANIDGAHVVYRVVRVTHFPFWWICRRGYGFNAPEVEIANGKTTTNEQGIFKIDFTALPDRTVDPASDPTFHYTVYADVIDINGETHSSSTSIAVGYKALQVNVQMPTINKSNEKSLKQEFYIRATNLAGLPEDTSGDIKIYALKSPDKGFRERLWSQPDLHLYDRQTYYKFFPLDLFDDENNKFMWPRQKEVFVLSFNTAKQKTFTIGDLAAWTEGEYVLEITAADKNGKPVKEISYFRVMSPEAKKLAVPAVKNFEGIKLQAEPGEKASFAIGTTEKKIKALYEVEWDGTIIKKEWVTLRDEQRIFDIPIEEKYRGNVAAHFTFVYNNRLYQQSIVVDVPFTNKALDISFESFRDKLQPGQQEQWKILVKGKNADKIAAEMVATLYDESLDVFRFHSWYASFYGSSYAQLGWQSQNGFEHKPLRNYDESWNQSYPRSTSGISYQSLNWFRYSFYYYNDQMRSKKSAMPVMAASAPQAERRESEESAVFADSTASVGGLAFGESPGKPEPQKAEDKKPEADLSDVKVRSNFNETAFFYPSLMTNDKGEIIINFTVPESLTRWKMLGFAHTQDLKSGMITNQLVTQKDLMVVPNQPRFFREGDKMKFSVKISSLVDQELSGQARLEFFDALTQKSVDGIMRNTQNAKNFSLKARQSSALEWDIEIPEGLQAITYRVVAKAGNFSDGEEMVLPVVTNRMLVTETLPLPIRGKQTKDFRFEKLVTNNSTTLRHQQFTLEFTSNPAWYAIQALPYLMEYPYDCVEQTFSKFYANSIASHIANSNPRIRQVFDTWKNIQPDALLSNLEKNQELKSALLEETPWVLQATDETQRKRMVGVLFDLNKMAREQEKALDKVAQAQIANGGFSWFPGFPEDRYMTQHIVGGLGHLDVLGVKSVRTDNRTWQMVTKALSYLDYKIKLDYDELKRQAKKNLLKLDEQHIGYNEIQYLYTRSYFKDQPIAAESKEAFDYYLGQAKKYWLSKNIYMEGMTCLALHRYGDQATPVAIVKSLRERALHSDEMGMYWKSDHGYFWYQAPIETQALMIEVFDEVAADRTAVEDLKVWLLKQKQTQDWKTTKATVEACYALLRRGTDLLASTSLVEIKVDNVLVDPTKRPDAKVEAGTGYFKTAWQASEIKNSFGNINVAKRDDGVAWGAAYWQYFEQLDKITAAETPLKLKKELFKQTDSDRGPVITQVTDKTQLHPGDLIKVRIELRSDRAMEYVHLKDMRASGFEPVSTLSTHKYQDGLYYYESPRDLATNFFIGYLPKGTYVFEYALRVSQKGDFSNGVTTIQCMYAPEFSSHSQGIRVKID